MVLVLACAGAAACLYLYPADYPVWFQGYILKAVLARMVPQWPFAVSHSCITAGFCFYKQMQLPRNADQDCSRCPATFPYMYNLWSFSPFIANVLLTGWPVSAESEAVRNICVLCSHLSRDAFCHLFRGRKMLMLRCCCKWDRRRILVLCVFSLRELQPQHSKKVAGLSPTQAFLYGVSMFSLCLCGSLPGTLASIHSPKTCMLIGNS